MNRLNTQNLIESISVDTQLQKSDPYILYKNATGEIYGIWFYDSDEREKIYETIERFLMQMNKEINSFRILNLNFQGNQSATISTNRNSSSIPKTMASVAQSQFPKSSALTKEQLKQVLQELVKDEDFVDLVYSEYLSLQSKGNM